MAKKPAVNITQFTLDGASPTAAPVPGVDGFVAYLPLVEVQTQGQAPVRPTLITTIRTPLARTSLTTASGAVVTRPRVSGGGGRPKVFVQWNPLTRDQQQTLITWARDILLVGQDGGRYGFLVQLEGATDSTFTAVRPTQNLDITIASLLQEVAEMECELLR